MNIENIVVSLILFVDLVNLFSFEDTKICA